jgi:hypothetical protein
MLRFIGCIAFVVIFLTSASAQSFAPVPAPAQVNLVGTINAKLKIRMKLAKQGTSLLGTYSYESQKKAIPLRGTVNEQGYFQMDEYGTKDSITGHIVGAFTSDNVVVGFWSKGDATNSPNLPVRLVEDARATAGVNNKLEIINANVRGNAGSAQLLLIDDTIVAFSYQNVGGNAHTCTLITDRSETNVQWQSEGQTTTINFTKEYFKLDDNTAKVVITKNANAYTLTFAGYLQYFCGARARLPQNVTLRKSGKGWSGQSKF